VPTTSNRLATIPTNRTGGGSNATGASNFRGNLSCASAFGLFSICITAFVKQEVAAGKAGLLLG
jgi:hypothetical protein